MENSEKIQVKSNFWMVKSCRTTMDRNGNIASVYLLLANPSIHEYTKKLYFTIGDFVDVFGQPVEFSEKGISAACVGTWLELTENMELLDEEPIQTK